MDGKTLVRIVQTLLSERGISKGDFYNECGISSATFSQWRTGLYNPTPEKIRQIEEYLGVSLSDYEEDDESDELREMLRDRQDLRILLHSAKDVPASSVYALISQLEKMKEDSKGDVSD